MVFIILSVNSINGHIEDTSSSHASGRDISLTCDYDGLNSNPSINWYRNNAQLDTDSDKYESSAINNSLTIRHAGEFIVLYLNLLLYISVLYLYLMWSSYDYILNR